MNRKGITILIILTFLMMGISGFMIMAHDGGSIMAVSDCPLTATATNCPMTVSAHVGSLQAVRFVAPQIMLALFTIACAIILFSALERKKFFSGLIPVPIPHDNTHDFDELTQHSQVHTSWLARFEHSPSR